MWQEVSVYTTESTQRWLAQSGALLMFLALLSGGYLAAAMGGQIDADLHSVVATHLNGLFGALTLFALGWTLPWISYSPITVRRVAQALVLSTYANFVVTGVKALLHVAGVAWTNNPANNAIFIILNTTVVAPGLIGTFAWFWGLRSRD